MCYDTERPLENDIDDLAFKTRSTVEDIRLILKHKFQLVDDKWVHPRCEKELSEWYRRSDKAKAKAVKRWEKSKSNAAAQKNNAVALPQQCRSNATASKNDATHIPINPNTQLNTPLPPKGGGTGKTSAMSLESAKQIAIPETLATDGFPQAWHEWLDFRWRIKKPLQEMSLVKQLQILEPFGAVVAVKAIQTGIANSYQGLFPEKEVERGNSNQRPRGGRSFTDDVADLERWAARESGGFNPS